MKFVLLFLIFGLTACTKDKPRQYVCFTPMTPLSGVGIDTADPQVAIEHIGGFDYAFVITTPAGNQIVIPKGQCVEVRNAQSN